MFTRRQIFARLAGAAAVAPMAAPLLAKSFSSAPVVAPVVSENTAVAIVKKVSQLILPLVRQHLVMGNLVARDYEATLAMGGDTVNVPLAPNLVANNIAEAGAVQNQNPRLGNARFVLKHMEATLLVPDIERAMADPEYLKNYMRPAAIALAEDIEQDLLNAGSRWFKYIRGWSHSCEDALDAAETVLFKAKVPGANLKYLVLSGRRYSEMRQLRRFDEYKYKSEHPRGAKGRFKDFHVFLSPLASATTGSLAFARDGLGLITRKLPTPVSGLGVVTEFAETGNFGMRVMMALGPKTLAPQFTVDVLYGAGVLRDRFGVQLC
jgi:hypothetical protein